MPHQMPPDDDPIIRGLRESGLRPFSAQPAGPRSGLPFVFLGIVGALFLFILFPTIASRLADWLWYREIGFERVFFTKIIAQWSLGIVSSIIAFAFLYANARIAMRGADTMQIFDRAPRIKISGAFKSILERGAGFVAFAASLIIAILVGLGVGAQWRTALQFMHRTPFGVVDPIFNRDVGFYVFTLPVIELVLQLATICAFVGLIAIALPIHLASRGVFALNGRVTVAATEGKESGRRLNCIGAERRLKRADEDAFAI